MIEKLALDLFATNLVTYGEKVLSTLRDSNASFDTKLAATYYDGMRVFQNLHAYTGDFKWIEGVNLTRSIYRDKYVIANNGNIPGFWNFSDGMTKDSPESQRAVVLMSKNGAYARDTTPTAETAPPIMSREVAYVLQNYLNAETLGEARRARFELLLTQALTHIDQWFFYRSAPYVRPFMVALTCEALIKVYEKKPDPVIERQIKLAADHIWVLWVPEAEAFRYTDKFVTEAADTNPAPDLNLLISPVYAWLYKQTGDTRYRDKADLIFTGGVKKAYLGNGKQFNQNYRWAFDFLKWRGSESAVKEKLIRARDLINEAIGGM